MRKKIGLSALDWLSVEAVDEMKRKSSPTWEREASSKEEVQKKEGKGVALLIMVMTLSVRRERALWS